MAHQRQRAPWLLRLETELDNLRAAVGRSLDGDVTVAIGLELASRMLWFWYLRGRIIEGRSLAETILAHPAARLHTADRGRILMGAGALAWTQGDFTTARTWLAESVDILRDQADGSEAFPLTMMGATLASQQDYPEARRYYEAAIAAARAAGDPWTEAFATVWLGDLHLLMGDAATARRTGEEGVALFAALGDDWGRAMALHSLAVDLVYLCDYPRARAEFDESARIMREADDKYALARVLSGAADLAVREGDHERAWELLEEATRLWSVMGNQAGLLLCLDALARVAAQRGQAERAALLLGAAGEPLRTVGSLSAAGDPREREALEAELRARLGDDVLRRESARGAALTVAEAVAIALENGD